MLSLLADAAEVVEISVAAAVVEEVAAARSRIKWSVLGEKPSAAI